MVNKYFQKNKKSFEKKHLKGTKIFLNNKKKKGQKKPRQIPKSFWRGKRTKASVSS